MTMSLKERMAQKKLGQPKKSITGISKLKSRIGSGGSSIRDKFQKRDQTILDKTYEDRNERSKSGGTGKTIFNQELMAEYGIEDFANNYWRSIC